ncbi:VOC family protein [Actinomycetospora lutea]|uniref:VOC family protein n=1 Tax=Actinomycetospora lutea TaxID=663604 RepID=UPI002366F340|nr:VOC family protein [Actinomycetospora lutea]MDD7937927.1 VOC family protein [Actinomycetospora lutea]
MSAQVDGILQVKLPVTDLSRSVAWYRAVLGLRLWMEFVEDGELCGAGLIDDEAGYTIALRDRRATVSGPDLRGFDVVALHPTSSAALEALAARCDELGVEHSGIRGTPDGSYLDVPDPDGTVLRFYHYTGPTAGFTGMEMRDGAFVGTYDTPRSLA